MRFVVDSCGEVECSQFSTSAAIAELEAPQSFNHERTAGFISQRAQEVTADWVERVDRAIAEIADEEIATESAETLRRDRQAPRCIQHSV